MASIGLAFLAGVLSTLSPCVLPLLPIVLGAAVSLWVFTEASVQESVWAAGSLLVGVVLVVLTRRAARKQSA